MKTTVVINNIRQIEPVAAKSRPMVWEKSSIKPHVLFTPNIPQMAAVAFSRIYCTAIFRNGPIQIAKKAKIPYIPAVFFITPALTRIASEASEMILPTTGTIPETVIFVAFRAIASAEPLTTPVKVIYPVKIYRTSFSSHDINHLIKRLILLKISSPTARFAMHRDTKMYIMGINSFDRIVVSTELNRVVPAYKAADLVTPPWEANAVVMTGINSFP